MTGPQPMCQQHHLQRLPRPPPPPHHRTTAPQRRRQVAQHHDHPLPSTPYHLNDDAQLSVHQTRHDGHHLTQHPCNGCQTTTPATSPNSSTTTPNGPRQTSPLINADPPLLPTTTPGVFIPHRTPASHSPQIRRPRRLHHPLPRQQRQLIPRGSREATRRITTVSLYPASTSHPPRTSNGWLVTVLGR